MWAFELNWEEVLVSGGLRYTLPQTCWLRTTELYLLTVWRPEVWDQGVSRAASVWRLWENLSQASLGLPVALVALACGCVTLIFVILLGVCLIRKDIGFRAHPNPG